MHHDDMGKRSSLPRCRIERVFDALHGFDYKPFENGVIPIANGYCATPSTTRRLGWNSLLFLHLDAAATAVTLASGTAASAPKTTNGITLALMLAIPSPHPRPVKRM